MVDLGKAGPGHYKAQVCRLHTILDCPLDPPHSRPSPSTPRLPTTYPTLLAYPGPSLYPSTPSLSPTPALQLRHYHPHDHVSHYPAPRLSLSSALSAPLTTITRPRPLSALPSPLCPSPCHADHARRSQAARLLRLQGRGGALLRQLGQGLPQRRRRRGPRRAHAHQEEADLARAQEQGRGGHQVLRRAQAEAGSRGRRAHLVGGDGQGAHQPEPEPEP